MGHKWIYSNGYLINNYSKNYLKTKHMRKQINEIVKIVAESLPKKIKVLEIGSLIVEGQEHLSVRKYFPEAEYIGVDMQQGNGVDVVTDCIDYCYGYYQSGKEFDLILCLDMLEHAKEPFEVLNSTIYALKLNGVLLVTSVFNFPIHEYPNDYWRFTPECFKMLLGNNSRVYKIGSDLMPHTVIGIQYPENMYLNINTEINKYCKEETEKELSWQNIVDYFSPKFIRLYMKIKMKIKNL